jgi:DNA-directed RNA polymerase subunit beta'
VEDGARVTQDQLLATWDPFTFAILTEVAVTLSIQDLKEGVTLMKRVDEVTGQSRMVVKDSPDEKKQPRLEVRNASNKLLKTYQMPVRANLMVGDGDNVEPATSSRRFHAKPPRPKTSPAVCRASSSCLKRDVRRKPRSCREIDGTVTLGPIAKGKRKLIITGDDGEGSVSTTSRAARTSTCRKAIACAPAKP